MAGAGRCVLCGVDGHVARRQGDSGAVRHRCGARAEQHRRRHPVPAQHRPGRDPQSGAAAPDRRNHRAGNARHRHGVDLCADRGGAAGRPLGAYLRGLFRVAGRGGQLRRCDGRGAAGQGGHARLPRWSPCDRLGQAFPGRWRHHRRPRPGRHQNRRSRAGAHPRRRLSPGDRRGRADRDGLVQQRQRRKDARPQGLPDRCAEGAHALRRLRGRRLERPRTGQGLHADRLPGHHQRRPGHGHGLGQLEGLLHHHAGGGEERHHLATAPGRCGAPDPAGQDAAGPVRGGQAVGARGRWPVRADRRAGASRGGAAGGARVAGAVEEPGRSAAAVAQAAHPGGRRRRQRRRQAGRRLDAELAGHRHHPQGLPECGHHLRRVRAAGQGRGRRGRAFDRRHVRHQAGRRGGGVRREPVCGVPGRSPDPGLQAGRRHRPGADQAAQGRRHSRGCRVPERAPAVGQPRTQRGRCLRGGVAARLGRRGYRRRVAAHCAGRRAARLQGHAELQLAAHGHAIRQQRGATGLRPAVRLRLRPALCRQWQPGQVAGSLRPHRQRSCGRRVLRPRRGRPGHGLAPGRGQWTGRDRHPRAGVA
ncbi:hypothetical protein NB689_003088 [Xanthomonas sacchari]|nr:hypothetical protein [Xanthomonas sacchari]